MYLMLNLTKKNMEYRNKTSSSESHKFNYIVLLNVIKFNFYQSIFQNSFFIIGVNKEYF